MLAIIVILLVAYIVIPLINLITNENTRFFASVIVYLLALLFVVWITFFHGAV